MGLELNRQGFCQTEEFHPAETSVKGIFVGGAFRGPRDIPETVVEGSSAAAAARSFLSRRILPQGVKEYPQEGALSNEIPNVGVFICHCGETLKKSLAITDLISRTKDLREVGHVEEVGLACLPEDLHLIQQKMGEHSLNRIVMAAVLLEI
jgi:heterodisulfide reductase subunit A-like polyferredoxin